jgi:hypothetical protein
MSSKDDRNRTAEKDKSLAAKGDGERRMAKGLSPVMGDE